MKYVIGLTGGIGSGKTMVSEFFNNKNHLVIDADKVGHSILSAGTEASKRIIEVFGKECANEDGSINRKILGSIVFSDVEKLSLLNSITHPLILEAIKKQIEDSDGIIILECALLFESNYNELCDEVWLIYADKMTRIKRIVQRNNITEKEAENRIKSQKDYTEYIKRADVVINNDKTLENLYEKTEKEYIKLIERSIL